MLWISAGNSSYNAVQYNVMFDELHSYGKGRA